MSSWWSEAEGADGSSHPSVISPSSSYSSSSSSSSPAALSSYWLLWNFFTEALPLRCVFAPEVWSPLQVGSVSWRLQKLWDVWTLDSPWSWADTVLLCRVGGDSWAALRPDVPRHGRLRGHVLRQRLRHGSRQPHHQVRVQVPLVLRRPLPRLPPAGRRAHLQEPDMTRLPPRRPHRSSCWATGALLQEIFTWS